MLEISFYESITLNKYYCIKFIDKYDTQNNKKISKKKPYCLACDFVKKNYIAPFLILIYFPYLYIYNLLGNIKYTFLLLDQE